MRARPRTTTALALSVTLVLSTALVGGTGVAASAPTWGQASGVTDATVERTDAGLTITWNARGGAAVREVRWSTDPREVDELLVESVPTGSREVTVADPSPGERPYFALVTADGDRTVLAERRIALEGDPNFRDLGGYETVDGRRVRWGQIYRSGSLDELTDADYATAQALGIKLVCDLRSPSEIAAAPDRAPTGAETLSIPVFDRSVDPQAVREAVLAGDVSDLGAPGELLTEGGRAFVTEFSAEYEQLMDRLMDRRYRPALVHCTAGKDRAALASAIVLLTLGVPEKTVMEDYLLSNTFLAEDNARAISQVESLLDPDEVEVVRALVEVRPEYLGSSLDAMVDRYGSIDRYLRKGLGISDAERTRFKRQMLER